MKTTKLISWVTAFLVFMLAVGSFALSYNALQDYASQHGITGLLSYVWPLLIDASLIVFSLAVVNAYLQSESTFKQWALVGVYTLATISFNVAHAPANLQAQIAAAIAPVSLFFSFELLMNQLKTSVTKHGLTHSIKELSQQYQTLSRDLEMLGRQRDTLQAQIEELRSIKQKQMSLNDTGYKPDIGKAQEAKQAQVELRREQVLNLISQGMSQPDIADELGVSLATVKRDTKALNGKVRVTR
jgi:uncharacterized protein YerC